MKLTRHNIVLRAGQMESLKEIYSVKSVSEVLRDLIDKHIREARQRMKDNREFEQQRLKERHNV